MSNLLNLLNNQTTKIRRKNMGLYNCMDNLSRPNIMNELNEFTKRLRRYMNE